MPVAPPVSEPLVSILIPTYNGEQFVGEALRSALQQTHRTVEVLVGDDASTDGTAAVLAAAAADDPRVRVLRHEQNLGAWDNPRRLLEEARGTYVKYLLHDDLLDPRCVEVLLAGLRAAPSARLAFSHRAIIDVDGTPLAGRQLAPLASAPGVVNGRELGNVVLSTCTNVIGEVTTVLFRRADVAPEELWLVDGRPLAANGDIALWLSLLARGDAWYTPETLSSFRTHGSQRTQNPRVIAGGSRDWPLLLDWGRRQGYLSDPAKERRALARTLRTAASAHAAMQDSPHAAEVLEALHLATARLVELRTGTRTGLDRPLGERAHGAVLEARFTQELDVWSRQWPFAVAAPTTDQAEVRATVSALRAVAGAGIADSLVVAVPPDRVAEVVPLLEAALAEGPDLDVDLVPAEDPPTVLDGDWLAVVPRGATWPRERAGARWTFDLPDSGPGSTPIRGGSSG